MGLLTGQTAVITGSSRGLGFAIAREYATEGANVMLAARTERTLNQAVAGLKEQGFAAEGFICDTSNHEEVKALAAKTKAAFGKIDIWVNNAGVGAPYGPTLSIPVDRFTRVIQTNILGVYYGSLVAMDNFVSQGSGKLINLVGRGADKPVPFQNAYASSKTWVKSFTLALAKEYRNSGINIIAFNPGLVLTEMLTDVEVVPGLENEVNPLNTVIRLWANTPEIPAKKALWLASSATDGKTGLKVSILTPGFILRGLAKEVWRKLTHRPSSIPRINVHAIIEEN